MRAVGGGTGEHGARHTADLGLFRGVGIKNTDLYLESAAERFGDCGTKLSRRSSNQWSNQTCAKRSMTGPGGRRPLATAMRCGLTHALPWKQGKYDVPTRVRRDLIQALGGDAR